MTRPEPPDLTLYLVTDAQIAATRGRGLVETVLAAVAGGVTAVQVREKSASARDFLATITALAAALPPRVPLIVNDRVDVFLVAREQGVRVDGVHLGQSDLPAEPVRAVVGARALIGLSASTPDQLAAPEVHRARVDYVGIGIVHATTTKTDAPPPLGVAGFGDRARLATVPAVAIGGIDVTDMAPLRAAGAAGAAVVSGLCAATDPEAAARAYAAAWGGAA